MTPVDPERERPLWQAALDNLRHRTSVIGDPGGRDRPLVDDLFVELYLLGERPSIDDVRGYLEAAGVPDGFWRRGLLRVWRERLERPTRRTRRARAAWAYPFVIPEMLVEELGLRPVPDRLADSAKAAAADYMRRAAADPGAAETRAAAELHALTNYAVRLWAVSRDRLDDIDWPSLVNVPRQPRDNLVAYATRTGRAREEARIEAMLRRRDEDEARARELGLFDDD